MFREGKEVSQIRKIVDSRAEEGSENQCQKSFVDDSLPTLNLCQPYFLCHCQLTLEGKMVNKQTQQGLDSFYNSPKVIDNIQHDPTQNHYVNSCDISYSVLSETSLSVENNPQSPIQIMNIHLITLNIYKRSTYTNIYTFRCKPEIDDMLHLSKTHVCNL